MLRPSSDPALAGERGFTVIELLVVVAIIGLLAAIALPSFLGQREKAEDAGAKTAVRQAAAAAKSYHADRETYAGMDVAELRKIEPSLFQEPGNTLEIFGAGKAAYVVDVTSGSGNRFRWSESDGTATRSCTSGGSGGCSGDGSW